MQCITNSLIKHQSFLYKQLNVKHFYFKQFCLTFIIYLQCQSTQFKCHKVLFDPGIGPYQVLPLWTRMDRGAMKRQCNEGILYISQRSSITKASPSDCLVSYPGHRLAESYPSAETQSVYSAAPPDWATGYSLGESYPSAERESRCILQPLADWATGHFRRGSLLGWVLLKSTY